MQSKDEKYNDAEECLRDNPEKVIRPRPEEGGKGVFVGFVVGFVVVIALCCFLGPCSGCKTQPTLPPQPTRIVPCKQIVDDMRALWSFERNYAYRHKSLASSISEMGDGTGIAKNGFVLKPALWAARIDGDNTQPEPSMYKVMNPATGRSETAKYYLGVFPVMTDSGERDCFSIGIVAVPEKPVEGDFCFVTLCGPVNLQNDFSFDKEWQVFKLKADPTVVNEFRKLSPTTLAEMKHRLTDGDLKVFVTQTFNGLYYPQGAE